jgi:Tol biopolymer transport system component
MKAPVTYLLIAAILGFFALTTCSKLSVNQAAPDVPSAPSPADGGTLDSVSIELSWTCSDPDGDPLSFDIYIDTSATPEVLVATVDTTSYTPVDLHYNSTYYWKVVATDTTGLATEGPIWSFSFGADIIVPACSLISPNGGEFWYVGADHDIEWEASDDDSIAFTRLEYSLNEGDTWLFMDSVGGNPQIYSWTVPDSIYSSRCLIRVTCQDLGDNMASDTSDTVLTLWPHGGLIAFSSDQDGTSDIFTMFSDGSYPANLQTGIGNEDYPSWSPDCSKIAFYSDIDGNGEIYVMNNDGSNKTNITNHADYDGLPAWSPLGNKIAFTTTRTANWEIYIMNPDGTEQYNLTNHTSEDWMCSWSPTGEQLVFSSYRDGNWEIYRMDADGSNQTRITTDAGVDFTPSWSPNGLLIAFSSGRTGNNEIFLMNVDGSFQHNITNHSSEDWFPQWSPDGSKIIFMSDRTGDWKIYTINVDGTNLVAIPGTSGADGEPDWSPCD